MKKVFLQQSRPESILCELSMEDFGHKLSDNKNNCLDMIRKKKTEKVRKAQRINTPTQTIFCQVEKNIQNIYEIISILDIVSLIKKTHICSAFVVDLILGQ